MNTPSLLLSVFVVSLTACSANNSTNGNKFAQRLASLSVSPNGTDITSEFLSKYTGKFVEPDFKENFVIAADGTVARTQVRQVGGGNTSKVPYETVCSYTEKGKIAFVEKRGADDRQHYMDFATHNIEVVYNEIALTNELEPQTTANPNCQTFLAEQKSAIDANGGLAYSYYTELLSDESFRIQTAGGGDYQEGGARTPSTLDEVYTKDKSK